jgi:1L-myo-inositol 1-phosphate cytidylyltransferase / CDP-L-myo-inositol myo-inositolphosphotransferase
LPRRRRANSFAASPGRQLDDWGPFERRFRLIGGRRNTFFWSLLPFAAFGAWWPGFLFILAYAGITTAVTQWRLLKALGLRAVCQQRSGP